MTLSYHQTLKGQMTEIFILDCLNVEILKDLTFCIFFLNCQLKIKLLKSHPNPRHKIVNTKFQCKRNFVVSMILQISVHDGNQKALSAQ